MAYSNEATSETIDRIVQNVPNPSPSGKILLIAGPMGSGKDSVGLALAKLLTPQDKEVIVLGVSNEIRAEVANVLTELQEISCLSDAYQYLFDVWGIPATLSRDFLQTLFESSNGSLVKYDPYVRTDESRWILQTWGLLRREVDPACYLVKTFSLALKAASQGDTALITGARYPNELEVANALRFLTIRLDISKEVQLERLRRRDGVLPSEEALTNISEHALDEYPDYSLRFDNSATRSPEEVAKNIVNLLQEKKIVTPPGPFFSHAL